NPESRRPFGAGDRARENDGASVIQQREGLLDREQRSLHIDVEQPVEMFFGDAAQGGKLTEAGIGEDNVDLPPFRLDGFVESIEVSQLGDVALDAGNIVPNGFHRRVKLLSATARDEDVGPLFDEELCRREAYSRGATGNDRHFSLQFAHSRCSW